MRILLAFLVGTVSCMQYCSLDIFLFFAFFAYVVTAEDKIYQLESDR